MSQHQRGYVGVSECMCLLCDFMTDLEREIEEDIRSELAQYRVCRKLEPRIVESNFMFCIKKLFDADYKMKTERWWDGRCIIDADGIKKRVETMFSMRNVNIVHISIKFIDVPMSATIYALLENGTYAKISLGTV